MPKTGYSCKQLRNYVGCGLFLACSMSPRLILLIWVVSKTDDGKTAALNISGNVMYQRCDCIMLGCLCLEFRDLIVRCFWVSCIYAENVPSPVQGTRCSYFKFCVRHCYFELIRRYSFIICTIDGSFPTQAARSCTYWQRALGCSFQLLCIFSILTWFSVP